MTEDPENGESVSPGEEMIPTVSASAISRAAGFRAFERIVLNIAYYLLYDPLLSVRKTLRPHNDETALRI